MHFPENWIKFSSTCSYISRILLIKIHFDANLSFVKINLSNEKEKLFLSSLKQNEIKTIIAVTIVTLCSFSLTYLHKIYEFQLFVLELKKNSNLFVLDSSSLQVN